MGRHTYTGGVEQIYADYRDAGTGQTLVASPGGTYDIQAAPRSALSEPDEHGDTVHVPVDLPVPPPDGRWADPEPVKPPKPKTPAQGPVTPSEPVKEG